MVIEDDLPLLAYLVRLEQAVDHRDSAVREYRAALLAAYEAGASFKAIAAATGLTRDGARKAVVALRR